MEDLPVEIVEHVLSYQNLKIEDILNFGAINSYFHNLVVNSNAIWKRKYMHRWPHFQNIFGDNISNINWFEEVKYIFLLRKRAHVMVSEMSPQFYKRYELSDTDLEEWKVLMTEHPRTYYYLVDDFMTVVNTHTSIPSIQVVPMDTPGNKTFQYYAIKVLRFIRQQYLAEEWKNYINLPQKMQILERGAVFVAQWCQPSVEVRLKDIACEFDHIAELVKHELRCMHENHPIFKTPLEIQEKWKTENLDGNQWNAAECKQIIVAMGVVLYKHLGFVGNNSTYYMPENSYINEVLDKKRGLPITLAIVHESVARRLGVKCEPISFPAHFLLRWSNGCEGESADSYYIDVFNLGHIIKKGTCPRAKLCQDNPEKHSFTPATARQVVERMANNLEVSGRQHTHPNGRIRRLRSTLELLQVINPHNLNTLVTLARLYMLHSMDASPLIHTLQTEEFDMPDQAQRVINMLNDYEVHRKESSEQFYQVEASPRASTLRYAVGMVMRHLGLDYKCVIYDWDPICLASPEWQNQMNVHKLSLKDEQPFYNVLVEDGSLRYVAQENIVPTHETGFLYLNEDIGRHFSHFFETHYVPNAEKEREYPADASIRQMYYQKLQFGLM